MAVLTHATLKVNEGKADALYVDDRLVGSFLEETAFPVVQRIAAEVNAGNITVLVQVERTLPASFSRIPASLNLLNMGIPQPE